VTVGILRIELHDGFDGDEVVCTIDGREVARLSAVRSSLASTLAAFAEVQAPDVGPFTVGVALPAKSLATDATITDPATERWLAVRVVEGSLTAALWTEPPPHL